MKLAVIVVFLGALPTYSIAAEPKGANDKQTACATAAFMEYNKANVALLTGASPIMSVEAQVAQRRLQESYCLQYARCFAGDPANQSAGMQYALEFSQCLEEEALEKYEAVKK